MCPCIKVKVVKICAKKSLWESLDGDTDEVNNRKISGEQEGFKKETVCMDQLFAIKIMVEKQGMRYGTIHFFLIRTTDFYRTVILYSTWKILLYRTSTINYRIVILHCFRTFFFLRCYL